MLRIHAGPRNPPVLQSIVTIAWACFLFTQIICKVYIVYTLNVVNGLIFLQVHCTLNKDIKFLSQEESEQQSGARC